MNDVHKINFSEDSACADCERYIKENHLEHIADEIRKAYRKGWNFGYLKQPSLTLKLRKEDGLC